ncbi:MAG TPA: DUF2911 domain-containing protein [Flavipsychrobacter sp.]|nr:DUF2911 domain-containing protein [Flavipsychrobacter sp.]
MKFYSFLVAAVVASTITNAQLKTPAPSPSQSLKQDFGLSSVTLDYSRPSSKGRTVFGGLVPYNKVWRTGANSSTQITFGDDVIFGGKAVKAGKYALYTIPKAGKWEVMLYSDLSLGGNVSKYDESKEVVRVTAKTGEMTAKVETFSMQFQNITDNSMDLELRWENARVIVPIKTEIDEKIMKSIEANVIKDSRPYFQAANYYYTNNKDMNQALEWTNKALEQNPGAFWIQALKARIQLKQNDKKGAAATAQNVIKLASEAQNDDYVKIGKDLLKQAQG